jgi:hypothetical protein
LLEDLGRNELAFPKFALPRIQKKAYIQLEMNWK